MKIFLTTNAVKNYITKEVKKSHCTFFNVKRFLFLYIVTEETIPDFY